MLRLLRLCLRALLAALLVTEPLAAQSILRDAETEGFFRQLALPLEKAAGLDPKSVQIVLIGDPNINAFAANGQNVYIHSGLIVAADNVNQLQGVIAHELGHIAGGHLVRFGEGSGPATRISLLSLVAAGLLIAAGAGDAGIAALGLGTAKAEADYLSFSRDVESRADQAGATFMRTAGISGKGTIEFFHKLLGEEYRYAVKQDNSYGRTHPLDGERISVLETEYRSSPYWNTPSDPALQAEFLRIKGKLTGFVEEPQRTFVLYPESDLSEGARYARAYAWHRSAYPDAANAEVDHLLSLHPTDPYFLELKGQILLEAGHPREALPVLRRAVAKAPNEPLIATLLGHALISTEDPKDFAEAKPLLRLALARDRENPFAWYQLGVIYDHEGDEPRAALAAAERYTLEGNPKSAAANARLALLSLPKDTPDWLRADDIAQVSKNDLDKKKHHKWF